MIQSRNDVGFSNFSNVVTVLAAQIPAQPVAPRTIIVGSNVQIIWNSPDNGGSAITSYIIQIRMNDGITFTTVTCIESLANIIALTQCTVPISTLTTAPISLSWGSSIYATITAVNIYGSSTISSVGTGAIIVTVPDAPMNLANNPTLTSGSQITITWA